MKEARYKAQHKTSAYEENTPTVTSPIHFISSGVFNYPEQIKVMPYNELVKMQERLTALEKLILEGPTEPEARRESEVYDEVVKLRERVAALEVAVNEIICFLEATR